MGVPHYPDPLKNTPEEQAMFEAILSTEKHTVEAGVFRQIYLPIIANVDGKGKYIEKYVAEIAIHWDSEVDVIENGKVIATVPPLRLPYPTEIGYGQRQAISGIIDTILGIERMSPVAAEKQLPKLLQARHEIAMKHPQVVEHLKAYRKRWDKLFVKFGLPPRFYKDTQPQAVVTTAAPASMELDDEDYEVL